MRGVARTEPKGRGQLLETPFCHLLLYLYRHVQDGSLVITHAGGETLIRIQRGRPNAARFPAPAARLLDGLLPLCGLREGRFAFYSDDLLGSGDDLVVGALDPYELLTASLENHARDDMVDGLLKRFAGQPLRLLKGRDLARMRIPHAHGSFLDLIRAAPATPEELIAQTDLPKPAARRLLYALIATHMVGSDDRREHETFRSQVEARSAPPCSPSSPASLSMPAENSPAWQRLVSLRPNTSFRPGSNNPPISLVPGATSIPAAAPVPNFSQRPPAAAQVSPRSQRPSSSGSLATAAADDPANRVKRIEQLLIRGRHDDAIAETEVMLIEEPTRTDLLALLAQALFEKHSLENDDGLPRHVLETIKRAAEADPDNPRTLYLKGLVAKRAGDARKAVAYFKRVLQSDPKHLEAAREIRLARLRADG